MGIDRDPAIVAYAKEQYGDIPRTSFYVCDIREWCVVTSMGCDTIIAFEVLEHMEDGREVAQILKKYCRCLLITAPYDESDVAVIPHHKLFSLKPADFPGFEYRYLTSDG